MSMTVMPRRSTRPLSSRVEQIPCSAGDSGHLRVASALNGPGSPVSLPPTAEETTMVAAGPNPPVPSTSQPSLAEQLSMAGQLAVDTAVLAVPGAEWVSITEPDGSLFRTRAGSSTLVWAADQAQYDSGEGPCLTASAAAAPVIHAVDLARDSRWPTYGRLAARMGIGSVLSFPLTAGTTTLGSLNLYGSTPYAFTDTDQQLAHLLARQAALTLATARLKTNLENALSTRDVIGQAKGVLMERFRITDEQAFGRLRAISARTNRKLRDIAAHVAASGELPTR